MKGLFTKFTKIFDGFRCKSRSKPQIMEMSPNQTTVNSSEIHPTSQRTVPTEYPHYIILFLLGIWCEQPRASCWYQTTHQRVP